MTQADKDDLLGFLDGLARNRASFALDICKTAHEKEREEWVIDAIAGIKNYVNHMPINE